MIRWIRTSRLSTKNSLSQVPGVHEFCWIMSFVSFWFRYPSTFNLLEVRSLDSLHQLLYSTGASRLYWELEESKRPEGCKGFHVGASRSGSSTPLPSTSSRSAPLQGLYACVCEREGERECVCVRERERERVRVHLVLVPLPLHLQPPRGLSNPRHDPHAPTLLECAMMLVCRMGHCY